MSNLDKQQMTMLIIQILKIGVESVTFADFVKKMTSVWGRVFF